jgi:hypothetical protein
MGTNNQLLDQNQVPQTQKNRDWTRKERVVHGLFLVILGSLFGFVAVGIGFCLYESGLRDLFVETPLEYRYVTFDGMDVTGYVWSFAHILKILGTVVCIALVPITSFLLLFIGIRMLFLAFVPKAFLAYMQRRRVRRLRRSLQKSMVNGGNS